MLPPPRWRHHTINPAMNSRRGEVMLHSASVYEAWNGYGRVWTKICCNPGSEQEHDLGEGSDYVKYVQIVCKLCADNVQTVCR